MGYCLKYHRFSSSSRGLISTGVDSLCTRGIDTDMISKVFEFNPYNNNDIPVQGVRFIPMLKPPLTFHHICISYTDFHRSNPTPCNTSLFSILTSPFTLLCHLHCIRAGYAMIAAVLVTAYKNLTGKVTDDEIKEAIRIRIGNACTGFKKSSKDQRHVYRIRGIGSYQLKSPKD